MKKDIIPADYKKVLSGARAIIDAGRTRAEVAVGRIAAETYWELGRYVVVEVLDNKTRAPQEKPRKNMSKTFSLKIKRAS